MKKSFIFDGYPRTIVQARDFDKIKSVTSKQVIYLDVAEDLLIKRLTGRLVCGNCHSVFHQSSTPAKAPGICDHCQGKLLRRADDSESSVKHRLQVYKQQTLPIVSYYEDQGILFRVKGDEDPLNIHKTLLERYSEITSHF